MKIPVEAQVDIDYSTGDWPHAAKTLNPVVYQDGNAYCCLLGPDPQAGIFGCGDSARESVLDWNQHLEHRLRHHQPGDEVVQYVADVLGAQKRDIW